MTNSISPVLVPETLYPPPNTARPAAPPLAYEFTVFQFTPSKNSSVPKSWLNLVVPGSGAKSLLFVSPRGTANLSVTVSVFVFPTSTVEPDDTVVSPVILI